MNEPLVLAHAGEEVLYILVPVALILWLKNVAARRAEREQGSAPDGEEVEGESKKPD